MPPETFRRWIESLHTIMSGTRQRVTAIWRGSAKASCISTTSLSTPKDSFHIEDQLVDGEKVVTRMTANVQIRETGELVTLLGINIARIVDGKLVEEWNTGEQTKATERLKPSVLSA